MATIMLCLCWTSLSPAQPQVSNANKTATQPGDKHDLRPLQRHHQSIKHSHHHHRPYYRPPYYHRSFFYHRPPYSIRDHRYHSPFIYVRPGYWYPPYRGRYSYYHRDLANIATFAVFAGITYAIVQDAYYRREGARYVYVRYPPSGNYTILRDESVKNSDAASTKSIVSPSISTNTARMNPAPPAPKPEPNRYKLGEIVDSLPHTKETVVVNGQSYFKYNNTWFTPLRTEHKFKVVESPL
ncbi:hypothetical protein AND4_10104 [Vibrio sp. AND4]|nr:hypothetical protein AND4_10104 [Vibrio sp. AND4]